MKVNTDPESRLVLNVEHVRKEFDTATGPLVVLKDVSLVLSEGDTVAIVGPSGSGKSTLLNVIGSLEKPTAGMVRLGATDVTNLYDFELAEYRARSVGFVFQDHHLLPQLTAAENVALPMLARGETRAIAAPAEELLTRVGLADRMNSLPAMLSGGERQRVAIARAMINRPALLLADEPTGNLDRDSADAVARLFLDLAAEHKAMLIVVTHNAELAARFGRIYELKGGVLARIQT